MSRRSLSERSRVDLVGGQRHRRVGAQLRPLRAREDAVGRERRRRCAGPSRLRSRLPRATPSRRGPIWPVRARELRLDLVERDAARLEHDQQVVEQVGGLGDQRARVLADRGERRLDRLLADFLAQCSTPSSSSLRGVGRLGARRARARATTMRGRGRARVKPCSSSQAHCHGSSRIGRPARAMCSLASRDREGRRNGRSRRRAPRWRGRRGRPRPGDRACRRRPRRPPAPAPRRRSRASARGRSRARCRRGPSR